MAGRMSHKTSMFVVAAALGCAMPFAAFAEGTEQQREACTPDAFRLCMMAMPDEHRVEDCLRRAGPRLSPACYAVFFPPTTGALAQPRSGSGQQPRPIRQQPVQRLPGSDDD